MKKNQYLITDKKLDNFENGFKSSWSDLNVYVDKESNMSVSKSKSEILIVGTVVDYRNPEFTLGEIAHNLSKFSNISEIVEDSNHLTGRFALFVAIDNNKYAIPDACALKRIVYGRLGQHVVITSSEAVYYELFADVPNIAPEVLELQKSKFYLKRESPWFGNVSADFRFRILLPNRILNISDLQEKRLDLSKIKDDNAVATAANLLDKTYDAIIANFKVLRQPLTAGFDSRILLAASLKYKEKIKYYVFGDPDSGHVDVVVPQKLAKLLDLDFSVVSFNEEISGDFLAEYQKFVLLPRFLKKNVNTLYHYRFNPPETLNLNGNGGEIFRAYYGSLYFKLNKERLSILAGTTKYPVLTEKLYSWYVEAIEYAKRNRLKITDLMYWEQRMGLWGATFPLEQDIAIEEISPFNNRYLLSLLLQNTSHRSRSGPSFKVATELVNLLNKDVMQEEINPASFRTKLYTTIIKPYTDIKILFKQVRKLVK